MRVTDIRPEKQPMLRGLKISECACWCGKIPSHTGLEPRRSAQVRLEAKGGLGRVGHHRLQQRSFVARHWVPPLSWHETLKGGDTGGDRVFSVPRGSF